MDKNIAKDFTIVRKEIIVSSGMFHIKASLVLVNLEMAVQKMETFIKLRRLRQEEK